MKRGELRGAGERKRKGESDVIILQSKIYFNREKINMLKGD